MWHAQLHTATLLDDIVAQQNCRCDIGLSHIKASSPQRHSPIDSWAWDEGLRHVTIVATFNINSLTKSFKGINTVHSVTSVWQAKFFLFGVTWAVGPRKLRGEIFCISLLLCYCTPVSELIITFTSLPTTTRLMAFHTLTGTVCTTCNRCQNYLGRGKLWRVDSTQLLV